MSKVTIQGNASGTGTFTIAAPNSNTDRTFNLPDSSGTVLASDSITVDDTTPLAIKTTNTLGSSFTGTTAGEGLEVSQTNYTAGNYVSLLEGKYSSSHASPHVRIGAMYDGGGSHLLLGTSSNYASGITQVGIEISEDGYVTTPKQPSFHAYANFNLNHGTSTTKYVWNLTRHNIGSHYDTSNGRFTAPIDGRYYFNIEALQQVDANSYYTRCYLYKNGSQYLDGLNTQALQSGYSRLHLNAVVEASAGDYFETYFVSNNSSAFVYATYSWFSGHLLG